MRCHIEDGHFIPGCMGCAAACGCGKSLSEIRSWCTCEKGTDKRTATLREQVKGLRQRVAELEKLLDMDCGSVRPVSASVKRTIGAKPLGDCRDTSAPAE
jgi:hypothetical protein